MGNLKPGILGLKLVKVGRNEENDSDLTFGVLLGKAYFALFPFECKYSNKEFPSFYDVNNSKTCH